MNSNRFTIIELLALMAIIIVLAGILLPAVQSARAKAKAAPSPTKTAADYGTVKLFDYDGVTVYRFHDRGDWRYFTVPVKSAVLEKPEGR